MPDGRVCPEPAGGWGAGGGTGGPDLRWACGQRPGMAFKEVSLFLQEAFQLSPCLSLGPYHVILRCPYPESPVASAPGLPLLLRAPASCPFPLPPPRQGQTPPVCPWAQCRQSWRGAEQSGAGAVVCPRGLLQPGLLGAALEPLVLRNLLECTSQSSLSEQVGVYRQLSGARRIPRGRPAWEKGLAPAVLTSRS